MSRLPAMLPHELDDVVGLGHDLGRIDLEHERGIGILAAEHAGVAQAAAWQLDHAGGELGMASLVGPTLASTSKAESRGASPPAALPADRGATAARAKSRPSMATDLIAGIDIFGVFGIRAHDMREACHAS